MELLSQNAEVSEPAYDACGSECHAVEECNVLISLL